MAHFAAKVFFSEHIKPQKSSSDSSSTQFTDYDDVAAWFQAAKASCPTGMSLPSPTSYLELEAFADILKQVTCVRTLFQSKFMLKVTLPLE